MKRAYFPGLLISMAVAAASIGVELALESRGGWGNFLLFSVLPESSQRFGQLVMFVAKPIPVGLAYSIVYFCLLRLPNFRIPAAVLVASVGAIVMCFGDVVV